MPKRAAVASKAKVPNKEKKNAKGFKFPEHIPNGFVLKDTQKREWIIGDTIGTGGFGEIYSACEAGQSTSSKESNYIYAVKVEPKENGPLYVEMHFYMRVAKKADIESWKKAKGLKHFGMPVFCGSGSFEFKSNNYRFLISNRLEESLESIRAKNDNIFPRVTVLQIGLQVLNVLEYIHDKGYIHGDIKAGNLLLGMQKGTENTVYIIDFGIASKCSPSEKEFEKDLKRVNNGTLPYISTDGHQGVFGFRGDLEMLGYNLIHWVNGSLPWEKYVTPKADPKAVEQQKIELMKDPAKYMKSHMPNVPTEFVQYMKYVGSMKNSALPDYDYCRDLFTKEMKKCNCSSAYGKLSFKIDVPTNKVSAKSPNKRAKKNVEKAEPTPSELKKAPRAKRKLAAKETVLEEASVDNVPTSKKKLMNGESKKKEESEPLSNDASNEGSVCNSEEERWLAKKASNNSSTSAAAGKLNLRSRSKRVLPNAK